MAQAFSEQVERILAERYFADVQEPSRPYSVYGYRFFGKEYGCGWTEHRRKTSAATQGCGG